MANDREDWQSNNRSKDLLIPPGLRLEAARKLRDQPGDVVIADIADYIDASIAADQSRVRRRRIGASGPGPGRDRHGGSGRVRRWYQEQETIRQTRAGALAAAGYARKFSDEGNARVGALVALGVIPASRSRSTIRAMSRRRKSHLPTH